MIEALRARAVDVKRPTPGPFLGGWAFRHLERASRALRGAAAVVVTHEHVDHIDVLCLAVLGVPVYVPKGAVLRELGTIEVCTREEFTAAGFRITGHGGRHAHIWRVTPPCPATEPSAPASDGRVNDR